MYRKNYIPFFTSEFFFWFLLKYSAKPMPIIVIEWGIHALLIDVIMSWLVNHDCRYCQMSNIIVDLLKWASEVTRTRHLFDKCLDWKKNEIATLCPPKWVTLQVRTASLPIGTVKFPVVSAISGPKPHEASVRKQIEFIDMTWFLTNCTILFLWIFDNIHNYTT